MAKYQNPNAEVLYRYDTVAWAAPLDDNDYPIGPSKVTIVLNTFPILSRTTCGVWIDYQAPRSSSTKKFVNLNARKQFANKSPAEAKQSFIARKKRQLRILKHEVDAVEQSLYLIESV